MANYAAMSDSDYRNHEMEKIDSIAMSVSQLKEVNGIKSEEGDGTMDTIGGTGWADAFALRNIGGCGFGSGVCGEPYAGLASNAERVVANGRVADCHANMNFAGQNNLSNQIESNFTNSEIAAVANLVRDGQMQTAQCCCDTKLLIKDNTAAIASSEARLTGLIKDTTIAGLERDLAECRQSACCNGTTTQVCSFINSRFPVATAG